MTPNSLIIVLAQFVLALAGLGVLWGMVFPKLGKAGGAKQPHIIVDVWGPLVMIGPLLFFAGATGERFDTAAWVPLGGPIAAGLIGLAVASVLTSSQNRVERAGRRWLAVCAWPAIGCLLLLLGAADEMTVWTGQVIFALAAVTLWCNTPAIEKHGGRPVSQAESMAGVWLAAAGVGALGQGLMVILVGPDGWAWSAVIALGYAVLACVGAVMSRDRWISIRMTGWAAGYGVLFGIGLLSMVEMFPQLRVALSSISGGGGYLQADVSVMAGLGQLAPLAALLIAVPGLIFLNKILPLAGRAVLAVAAIMLIVVVSISWVPAVQWPKILCSESVSVDDGTISTGD